MTHFTIEDWVDFVGGHIPEQEKLAMHSHLSSGCAECQAVVQLFERVRATAVSCAHAAEPPPEVVSAAKAMFPHSSPQSKVVRIFGRLVFDSFSQLMPAGARAAIPAFRHVLFHAGDYCLDLRLESAPNSIRTTLAGQITNRLLPDARVSGVEVRLAAGKRIISQTSSNEFGEFILDYAHSGGLRLEVPLGENTAQLQVSLNRLKSGL